MYILETGGIISSTVTAKCNSQMALVMKVNIRMGKSTAKANLFRAMALCIMVNGKMIFKMDMAPKTGLMGGNTSGSGILTK